MLVGIKIIKLLVNLICELIILASRIVFQDRRICGTQFAWAEDFKIKKLFILYILDIILDNILYILYILDTKIRDKLLQDWHWLFLYLYYCEKKFLFKKALFHKLKFYLNNM